MDLPKYQPIGNQLPLLHLMIERQELPGMQAENEDKPQECLSTEQYQRYLYKDTHFLCPLFVNFKKNRQINESAGNQTVTTVPIPVRHRKPKFWIKRNICILCYNETLKE